MPEKAVRKALDTLAKSSCIATNIRNAFASQPIPCQIIADHKPL